jgi:predicted  nucleic acid-binding Zn-ribbon protein
MGDSIMRRTTLLLSFASLALLAACTALFVKTRHDATSLTAMQSAEETTRAHYSQAIQDIAAIQDSLNAITLDNGAAMSPSTLSSERRLSPNQGDEALARIAELRAGIERARTRIQALESRLRHSEGRVAAFGRLVKQLKQELAAKEQLVADLTAQVASLQTNVAGLTATVQEHETRIAAQVDTLENRRRELGTVYYAIGSRQVLMKNGVVVAKGGVLGLGKTLDASGKLDEAAYQSVDTDQETVIPISAKKAHVLTPQTPSSYALEMVNGQLELRILDPHEFRKVRHLVIVTA